MAQQVADPREVGKTYHSHYWNQNYVVLEKWEECGNLYFAVKWEDGSITKHSTAFNSRDYEV